MVTIDGFTGYATAVDEVLPQARKVMAPFPRRAPGRGQTHRLSATTPARDRRASGTQGRSIVQIPSHPIDQDELPHGPAEATTGPVVGHRR